MKMIKHDCCLRQVFHNCGNVGRGHINRHRFYFGFGSPQTPKEGAESIRTFAIADKDNRAGFQVKNNCEIAVSLADADLIDGNQAQIAQIRLGLPLLQVLLLDFLDHAPAFLSGEVAQPHRNLTTNGKLCPPPTCI